MEALDGNAIAGRLHAAFGDEMTSATGTCATCGKTSVLAELRVYLRAPGAVARCPSCGAVQLVLIEARGVVCVDLSGLAALRIAS
jgi:ribosomal protein S27AE